MKQFWQPISAIALTLSLISNDGHTNSFGIYDSRTLAMGGTAVAIGTINNGHFYNPALTAFHIGDEDTTRDGKQSLHLIANVLSDGITEAQDAVSSGLDGQLGEIINSFNTGETVTQDAIDGYRIANELSQTMDSLDGVTLGADVFIGYSLSEPGDRKGGAFYMGTRLFASGVTHIDSSDFNLLDDYIELFDYIRSDGTSGAEHEELNNAIGALIDPSAQIQSSAVGTVAIKSEMAVSFSKIYTLWGQEISFGAAPKLIQLRIFDTNWNFDEGSFEQDKSEVDDTYFNVDLGLALNLGDHMRLGLSIKEAKTKVLLTDTGNEITLGAYKRLGAAFFLDRFRIGFDIDLSSAPNLQDETNRKDGSVGVEFEVINRLLLRGGYRRDLAGVLDDTYSVGLGWSSKHVSIEVAYTDSEVTKGGAFQFGFLH